MLSALKYVQETLSGRMRLKIEFDQINLFYSQLSTHKICFVFCYYLINTGIVNWLTDAKCTVLAASVLLIYCTIQYTAFLK